MRLSLVSRSVILVAVFLMTTNVRAQLNEKLFITEVMWDSSHPISDDFGNGGHVNGDWWELLNVSDEPIDMTGFMWDDDDQLAGNDFTIFPELIIQPKELLILVREEELSAEHEDGFRYAWDIPAGLRILNETLFADTGSGDTFSGLSSGGDELNLYDADGELIHSIPLEASTQGFSKTFGFVDGVYTELGLSELGVGGAFESRTDGSGERLTDDTYEPLTLDVSSAGHVEGFDIIIPGTFVDIDGLCGRVAAGSASAEELQNALATAGILPGDADQNGAVDFADFLLLSSNFGEAGTFSTGDFDCTGTVDFADFLSLSSNFGQAAGGVAAVPEPAATTLLLFGMAVLPLVRRARK